MLVILMKMILQTIEFEDGHKMNAYPEEIYLNDMIANGYKPD